jgi:aspartate kinase
MIVMKFGGTSVEDAGAIERLRAIVQERRREQPVVVVSAMATVTDRLLHASSLAVAGDEANTLKAVSDLQARHEVTAIELLDHSGRVIPKIEKLFEELRSVLRAVCALQELTPRMSDRIVSFGERLSTVIVTAVLEEGGVPAELVDSRDCILTDDNYGAAAPRTDETNDRLRDRLLPLLGRGVVPVLGGFIASNGKEQTTTLGRGGSDFSAAIMGAALGAERVDIWTDVDGIRTTDPRLYPQTRHIKTLSFHEAAELAHFGAKVLHPATLLPAMEKNIPVYVLNSRNPGHPGTRVQAESDGTPSVKAIAVKRGIILLEASAPRSLRRSGLAREVFAVLEQHGCAADVASISDTTVLVSLDRKELVPLVCNAVGPRVQVHAEYNQALVSLVADDIREIPHLAGQVFAALEGLDVRLVAQGASRWSVTVVVSENEAAEAVRRLHEQVLEQKTALAFVAD